MTVSLNPPPVPPLDPSLLQRGAELATRTMPSRKTKFFRQNTVLSRGFNTGAFTAKRDPVALTRKPHLFCTFFISKNVPFKPLDLSKCRFEFATLCTAFFILVFDYLILFYLSLNIIVLVLWHDDSICVQVYSCCV